jgi:hypothetical protein
MLGEVLWIGTIAITATKPEHAIEGPEASSRCSSPACC